MVFKMADKDTFLEAGLRSREGATAWRESSVSASRFKLTALTSFKRITQRLGSLANRLVRLASLMAERLRI